ncbi:TPA: tetratricopeptide repeat protein [Haemophilus influenzae]|uniref:tetratricopeptide repeat protein n=1 Tax=Haemophilus influenzae TaxID=727 RepID=UPI003988CFE8
MKFSKTLITTAILGFSLASFHYTAWADTPAQQFQQGLTAYKQSDYQTAFKLWLSLAEQGNAIAQFNLGLMYINGQGVKQDDFEAVKWFRKAAEQGYANAQINLGVMYKKGRGVKQDDVEAMKWYRQAAEQGNANAQALLGLEYLLGKGVQLNKALAKEWFGKACDNGEKIGCEYYGKLNRGEC